MRISEVRKLASRVLQQSTTCLPAPVAKNGGHLPFLLVRVGAVDHLDRPVLEGHVVARHLVTSGCRSVRRGRRSPTTPCAEEEGQACGLRELSTGDRPARRSAAPGDDGDRGASSRAAMHHGTGGTWQPGPMIDAPAGDLLDITCPRCNLPATVSYYGP